MVIVSIKLSEQIDNVLIHDHGQLSVTKHYINMSAVACPIPDCEYVTDDLDAAIVAALITAHATTHTSGAASVAKVDRVKSPVITAAGTSEEWQYFLSRWSDYVNATNVTGRDKALQLLECCDEPLPKDLPAAA